MTWMIRLDDYYKEVNTIFSSYKNHVVITVTSKTINGETYNDTIWMINDIHLNDTTNINQ